ncbi:P-loop containing nucleoside triphosphate hydrolase protein [Gigaspora rosea]|uniref:P-loop containing nucleoside triphosphate hydrolase protein n=1 Tax=Gigaspora rosea TaxID=44941 RepID=A0A397W7S9_9GLOM|nr:P-loop containing nucleoside triphosphate hydrolase protein [Gigaspora rosea]
MAIKFFEKLSIDYLGLLEDKEYFNVIVNTKESSDTKIIYAHSNVLRYRSLYFRNELPNISKYENNIKIINLKNVSTQQFEIIVKYIYGGTILLENQDTLFICELIIVACEFLLEEFFQNQQLQDLQKWCNNIVAKYPEKVFESGEFISLQENALVSLIGRNDLRLEEIKIWNYVIQWGIAQNPGLPSDPKNWSCENFLALKTTLKISLGGHNAISSTPGQLVSATILPPHIISSPILPSRTTGQFSSVKNKAHVDKITSGVNKQTMTYSGNNIKVVIICHPFNSRELAQGAKCLIRMEGNQTIITRSTDLIDKDVKAFTFDKSYWSFDKNDPNYTTQAHLYNDLGENLLNHAFNRYNTCIFATGAGKSYSMIYNECVRDLLNPKNKGIHKVKEHPTLRPYMEDLSKLIVNSFQYIENLMDESKKARAVAATNMNVISNRSHVKRQNAETNIDYEKVSQISFVDLASSEHANSTGASGACLKEGANINKPLTTFGKVIAFLADVSSSTSKKGAKKVLKWLLKDSLGGNSKTYMIAAISPADYDKSLITLRYADAVRFPTKKIGGVEAGDSVTYDSDISDISDNQQVITFEDCEGNIVKKTKEELCTEEIQLNGKKNWENLYSGEKNAVGVHPPKKVPHLVNLNEDPLISECLVYQIKPGFTRVGHLDSDILSDIRLNGEKIMDNHCYFENERGVVTLYPSQNSTTVVNG